MARYQVYFKMVDHFNDDAGYLMPTESTIVDAVDRLEAVNKFHSGLDGEDAEIIAVTLIP